MFSIKRPLVAAAIILSILGVATHIPVAQAQQPVDITDHFYATITVLSASPELSIFHSDVKGIVRDNLEKKVYDNMTSHCLRSGKVSADKMTWTTYSKFTDPDGDFFITETSARASPSVLKRVVSNFFLALGSGKAFQVAAKASSSL